MIILRCWIRLLELYMKQLCLFDSKLHFHNMFIDISWPQDDHFMKTLANKSIQPIKCSSYKSIVLGVK